LKNIPCQILAASKRIEAGLTVPDMCRQLDINTAAAFLYSSPATMNLPLFDVPCYGRTNIDHLCRLRIDQGLSKSDGVRIKGRGELIDL